MSCKTTIAYLLLMIVFFNFAQAILSNVPPPPTRPDYFKTKEELRRYLQKLHEYHLILGRWRSRRGENEYPQPFDERSDTKNYDFLTNESLRRLRFRPENALPH
ncbi:unnamed protein product [Adineta ricciae]|uniref:Uncharacterized protein n=1 Tax=Adineta ricciae TaxID=249248 RepID=A0A815E4D6_ADIRI|nr:unnamed protein product [Adineta ricciae]